jgi:AraC family transcriptional activator of pobA
VYVRRGRVDILSDEPAATLVGPSVAWLPWGDGLRLRIAAGTVGVHVLAGAAAVTNAIGYKAESADLRMTADRRIRMSLLDDPRAAETVAQCFGGILEEARGNAVSSPTVIEAFLRILLITLWRGRGAPSAGLRAAPTRQRLMSRFNALLEAHFRERWNVKNFAATLGVSPDRLTDICRRTRGQSPKQIIDPRTTTDASLLLTNSTTPMDQIAHELGFPSAAPWQRRASESPASARAS